jgi:Amt family ammonium transporter
MSKTLKFLGAAGATIFAALPAFAQEAAEKAADGVAAAGAAVAQVAATAAVADGPIKAPTVEQMAGMVDKGDTTWMLISSALVLLMSVPALALFYGGLVRTKNMLSLLMQVFMIVSVAALVWVSWGYTLAFTSGTPFIGGFSKLFLQGVDATTVAATFSNNVYIPEYAFVVFQMTFACITPALIVGAFAERIKFTPLILFVVAWLTIVYFPIAHMVWYWAGPDFLVDAPTDMGYLWGIGALDFAGGTVVHINAGVAGLVGAFVVGKRVGYGREAMSPHSLTMTMVGAAMLLFGWFGFNAGSALEANGSASLAFMNTFLATACAVLTWIFGEWIFKGKPSMLGAASGAVAGLVAITPAAGNVGIPGAFVIGSLAGLVCLWGVNGLKKMLGADDALDVFGVHALGGILGALLTGIFNNQDLGGPGLVTDWVTAKVGSNPIMDQLLIQAKAVGVTVIWTAVVAYIAFKIADVIVGLRVAEEAEREGLDLNEHGEAAYHM